jgi:nicotinamide mononucleotide transporter
MLDSIEIVAVVFAIVYLALAIRQSLWCWPAALVSVTLFMILFYYSRWYLQSILQIYYFGMAIYGWIEWRQGGERRTGVRVHWWPPIVHLSVLSAVIASSAILGWALSRTDAAFPYLDSFTTVGALVTTFMVARKVIENWIYWFVIDCVLVYMSWQGDLPWTAGLYALYLAMVVIGFFSWLISSHIKVSEEEGAAAG